jgi:ligand-binding sensor domain-containing protein
VVASLTLFAGTPEGLWRSPDWGATWSLVVGPSPGDTLASLGAGRALVPQGPQVWVAGGGGLFLSEDFGVVWRRLFDQASALCIMPSRYPQSDPTVFMGTISGLLRSEDSGLTFKPTALTNAVVSRLEWPGPALVAGTSLGVLVSEDGGRVFRDRGVGLPEGEVQALAVSSFFALDPVVFAGGAFGVYRSADAGRTWKATGLTGRSIFDLVWLGPFLYATGDGGVARSDDNGQTWTPLSEGLAGRQGRRLMFPLAPAAGLEAFVGTDDGIFRTLDGGQHWQKAGLESHPILSLATFPAAPPSHSKRKK